MAKMGVMGETSGISQLLGAAKLQSAPDADNPRYATAVIQRKNRNKIVLVLIKIILMD